MREIKDSALIIQINIKQMLNKRINRDSHSIDLGRPQKECKTNFQKDIERYGSSVRSSSSRISEDLEMEEQRLKMNEESKSETNENDSSKNLSVGKQLIKNYLKKEQSKNKGL